MIHLPSITDPNIYLYESVQITIDLLMLFLNLGMIKSWSTQEKKYTTWRHPPSMCFPIPAHFSILFTSLWIMQLLEIAWFDSIDLCDVVWCMHIGALWTFGASIAWQHQENFRRNRMQILYTTGITAICSMIQLFWFFTSRLEFDSFILPFLSLKITLIIL
eukprot:UN26048